MPAQPRIVPVSDDWVVVADVRREIDKDIFRVLEDLEKQGWKLKRQGHKFYIYCPCGEDGSSIRVDGTPKNPSWKARMLRKDATRCPDRHELLRKR